jgi:hypothetical protein
VRWAKFRGWQLTDLLIFSGEMDGLLRVLTHGAILAVGVLIYSALAIGAFQQYFHAASVVWMVMLIGLGVFSRRRFWPEFSTAIVVIGVGLFVFFLVSCGLTAVSSPDLGLGEWISAAFEMTLAFYLPWFWLPFAFGAALGGIHWKRVKLEPGGP